MKLEHLLETALHLCELDLQKPILVGVSGGPDSLCLLDGLAQVGFSLIVAHFDHQLRSQSAQDAETVRAIAAQHGLPFILGQQDVAAEAKRLSCSLEEAARNLRYHFLFEQARLHGAQAVAVGHTADDQAETVLMHLLRGAGLDGLTGMRYRSPMLAWDPDVPLVRPLLDIWREETLGYCREHALQPVFDATNQDTVFLRNRIRHELIPTLETYNPRIRQNLWRTADILAGDAAVLESAVQTAWEGCQGRVEDRVVSLHLNPLETLQQGLQRAVLRRAIQALRPTLADVDFASVERALRFVNTHFVRAAGASASGQVDLVDGLILTIEGEKLWIGEPGALPLNLDWPQLVRPAGLLALPGETEIAPGWRLSAAWQVGDGDQPAFLGDTRWEAWLDAETLPAALAIRCAQPGDRFQPLGLQGHSIKLSDFWVNQKLPRRARAAWPLIVAGPHIVWIPGYRLAEPYRVRQDTRQVLHLKMVKE